MGRDKRVPKRIMPKRAPSRGVIVATKRMRSKKRGEGLQQPAAEGAVRGSPQTHSRFFFDMLMRVDTSVVGEFIIPHLPNIASPEGRSMLVSMVCASHLGGAGVYGRNLFRDLFLPAVEASVEARRFLRDSISFNSVLGMVVEGLEWDRGAGTGSPVSEDEVADAVAHGTVAWAFAELSSHAPIFIDLDVEQCSMCSSPVPCHTRGKWGCSLAKKRPHSTTCIQSVRYASALLKSWPLYLHRVSVSGVDMATPTGAAMVQSLTAAMSPHHARGPRKLEVESITIKGSSKEDFSAFLKAFTRQCQTVVLGEFTVMGGARVQGTSMYVSNYVPGYVFESIQEGDTKMFCMVDTLTVSESCMPITNDDRRLAARSILRMPLISLDMTCDCKGSLALDSVPLFLDALEVQMQLEAPMRFHHLENLTISLRDDMMSRASSIVSTMIPGLGEVLDVAVSPVPTCSACSMCFERMPVLKTLVVLCGDNPVCSLKLKCFLASFAAHRDGVSDLRCRGSPTSDERDGPHPIERLVAWSKFMPDKLVRTDSAFHRHLQMVSAEVVMHCKRPYFPAEVVQEALAAM